MTTITIKDAAILSHLSKQPVEADRILLTSRLGPEAKELALKLIRCPVHPGYKAIRRPTSKKSGCICKEIFESCLGSQH